MPRPIIKEKLVVAHGGLPLPSTGEAFLRVATQAMTPQERQGMFNRLDKAIFRLISVAEETYEEDVINAVSADAATKDDYVVRLSTNEFFFYTQEPLTLQEFERLCDKLAWYAEKSYSGIHLILGSFAVITDDNFVMNVTPYIQCGEEPYFHFIVKNHTSSVDVRYHKFDKQGKMTLLKPLDVRVPNVRLPNIFINGKIKTFLFDNIILCKTGAGTLFLTAVDICLDHILGVARENMRKWNATVAQVVDYFLSHVVISNTTGLASDECLVPRVVHVDPQETPRAQAHIVAQELDTPTEPLFGCNSIKLYNLAPAQMLTRREVIGTCLQKREGELQARAQYLQSLIPSLKSFKFYARVQLNLFDTKMGIQLFFETDFDLKAFTKALDNFQLPYKKNEQYFAAACSGELLEKNEADLNALADHFRDLQIQGMLEPEKLNELSPSSKPS